MSKRRRSEVSEASSEESVPVFKKLREEEWTVPRDVNSETELCSKLFDFLRKYKDSSDSCLSECLLRAPSRRQQPDYYDVISSPIDLLRIQQKLRTDSYKTVQDFINDAKLLFDNTKTFYSPSTSEYKSAVALESVFLSHLQQFGFSSPSEPSSPMISSLTLRIPKVQLPSLRSPQSRSQLTSSSSESSVSTPKPSTPSAPKQTTAPQKSSSVSKSSTKGTRSRAWIDEYVSSDDPLKVYVALVFNFHDSSGDFVAEVFQALPSRKEYPGYYRIITEPIDLNTIKKNVDSGHYSGLKALQEDMILMVKNAHYFNEPGSVLYKKASALRKFIINKGAELWRKYQLGQSTVPQPQLKVSLQRSDSMGGSDGEGEARKVPKLSIKKSEEGMKVQRRRSQLSSEMDESQSESSEEEVSSDEETGEKQQQLMLHIKKEKLAGKTPVDPLTKLLRIKRQPVLHKVLMAIYRCLMTKTDQGRLVCELFRKRPSAKVYPEYYIVIKQPIDLKEIREKIKNGGYSSVDAMMSDVELLVSNACTFNEEDSVVYADALLLRKTAQNAVQQIQQKWPEMFPSARITKSKRLSSSGTSNISPGLKTEVEAPNDVLELFSSVKEYKDSRGRFLWKTFEKLPSTSTSGDSAVKKHTDMSVIQSKLSQGHYLTVDSMFDDLSLLFDNAYSSYSQDTIPAKDSLVLHRVAVKKYQQLRAAERETNPVPNVQDCVQKLLKEIVTKTFKHKDSSGHSPIERLHSLEATDEFQHPDISDTTVQRSLTLSQLQEWVCQGKYPRLDHLQKDILLVLRKGRAEFGSPVYQDAVAMERRWIQVRDEVCKKGCLLWSPALAHTLSALDAELTWEREQYYRLANPQSPLSDSEASSEGDEVGVVNEDNKGEDDDEGVLVDKRDVEYVTECECEGVRYRVGDVVYVKARVGSGREPHIVLVETLWKDTADSMWLDGCWFYRPVETFHPANRKFYKKEVFKSDFHSIAKLSRVIGKCGVLPVRDYTKYRIEGIADEDTYMCESRYSSKAKSFRKIKVWSMPGVQPHLLPRATPLSLHKVPSVFASTAESASVEAMDVDMCGDAGDSRDGGEAGDSRDGGDVGDSSGDREAGGGDASFSEEDEDKLKLSFSADLKNITISVTNPESGCTYYEQYCIDNDHFRLGDFVFLRSDQELAYIAKIEKMWTDANDDPWIHGPWFIRPRDVNHAPTRVFYEKELFQSNIQDTNPMRSICGRCAVVSLSEYCKKRSTQYIEDDVFITESRYNEAEKKIIKLRGIKHHQLSESVVPDEVYHFPKEISPIKAPSPKLFSKEFVFASPTPPGSKEESRASTPTSSASTPLSLGAQLTKKQANIINLNPQLVQQLLASASKQMIMTPKGPVPMSTIPTSLPSATTPSPTLSVIPQSQPTTKQTPAPKPQQQPVACVCQWTGCEQRFANVVELGAHVLTVGIHIIKGDAIGDYYCKWKGCHRNPLTGGKPFDTVAKLTRHLREVHLLKLSNTMSHAGTTPLSALAPIPLPTPVARTPTTTHTPPTTTSTPSTTSTPPSTEILTISHSPLSSNKSPLSTPTGTPKVPNIFHPPPENRRQIAHSAIYMNYIRGLQANSPSMSSSKPSSEVRGTAKPPGPVKPSDWLGPNAMAVAKDTRGIVNALWALRDHLLKESTKLDEFNKSF